MRHVESEVVLGDWRRALSTADGFDGFPTPGLGKVEYRTEVTRVRRFRWEVRVVGRHTATTCTTWSKWRARMIGRRLVEAMEDVGHW